MADSKANLQDVEIKDVTSEAVVVNPEAKKALPISNMKKTAHNRKSIVKRHAHNKAARKARRQHRSK